MQRITNAGERRLLTRMLGAGSNPDLRLRLFVNNLTITSSVVASDFTAPAFSGYAAKTLASADWSTPVTTDNKGDVEHVEKEWTYTGATEETCYGYFIDDPTDDTVILVHKFDTPRQIVGDGAIAVTPRLLAYDPSDA
jgi:hypothetical protein